MSKNTIAVIASLILAACVLYPIFLSNKLDSLASLQDSLAPKVETQFSEQWIASIQAHDFEAVKKYLDPKIADDQFKKKFDKMTNLIPSETPKNIRFIGAMSTQNGTESGTGLSLEYDFPQKWILITLNIQKQGDTFIVTGLHFQPLNDSLVNLTRFTFWGQDTKHYIVFASALLLLLFTIYALALCIKTPMPKRKWLWIIFILTGFCSLTFNWMTGELFFTPIAFRIPLIQFSQMLYQPFSIAMLFPLGAIIFLIRRKHWLLTKI